MWASLFVAEMSLFVAGMSLFARCYFPVVSLFFCDINRAKSTT
jgi:hypothetical protein